MEQEADSEYAYEKLRQRAEQVSGVQIEYLYEHEMIAAKAAYERKLKAASYGGFENKPVKEETNET